MHHLFQSFNLLLSLAHYPFLQTKPFLFLSVNENLFTSVTDENLKEIIHNFRNIIMPAFHENGNNNIVLEVFKLTINSTAIVDTLLLPINTVIVKHTTCQVDSCQKFEFQ